ncbi:hypothetical protein [Derxia gummosa]|uniref:Uncharacterized protein n=1 Tax=Derxia gummosa DSM 723 TaxID=1121388 RepID=A0A8B6X0S6_9BURK|nr:hypothetical protein [Derxia gummosa]
MNTFNPVIHDTKFVWDDGRGETWCTREYVETRYLHRIALGRAAEARLGGQNDVAEEFEHKARGLSRTLQRLRDQGHLGRNEAYENGEFSKAFKSMNADSLRVL